MRLDPTWHRAARVGGVAAVVVVLVLGLALSPTARRAGDLLGGGVSATTDSDACGPVVRKADGTPWSCSFVDAFAGTAIDPARWLVGETSFSGFRTGLTCMRAGNVVVGGGTLRITARDEGRAFSCSSPAGTFATRYTGGHLGTTGRFSQVTGRFEVRARHPRTTGGVNGGFWLYPARESYGEWPRSGEIDVAEWWSAQPRTVLPSLHYPGSDPRVDSGWGCTVDDPTRFHTYAVEWTVREMRFLIDGAECFRRTPEPASPFVAPQPFDRPFVIVLNMGVGPARGRNAVTPTTVLPATYEVDYVKAWR